MVWINREYMVFSLTTEKNMRELWPADVQITPHFLKHPDTIANNSKENSYGIKRWSMRAIFKIKAFYCMFCYPVSQLRACAAEKSKTDTLNHKKGTLFRQLHSNSHWKSNKCKCYTLQKKRLPDKRGRCKKKPKETKTNKLF